MKARTIRTFDELAAFFGLLAKRYSRYDKPRLAHVYYGVFDVDDGSKGMGEGDYLVAGAAVSVDQLDILQVDCNTAVKIDYLIVREDRRGQRIGSSFLKFILDLHNDRDVRLEVSPLDCVDRLIEFYGRYGFEIIGDHFDDTVMKRPADEDCDEEDCAEKRDRAANSTAGSIRMGFDLSDYKNGGHA